MTKSDALEEHRREVAELREKIGKLKGRTPRSHSLTYLRELHDSLVERKRSGEDVRVQRAERTVPASLSLLPSQLEALDKFCDKTKRSRSELTRVALAEYAHRLGFESIARALQES